MYPNLNAEMARAGITRSALAEKLGITPSTLSLKLNGKSELSFGECVRIKKIIGTDIKIEQLFAAGEPEREVG